MSARSNLLAEASGWRHLKAHIGAWIMPEFIARKGIEYSGRPLPKQFQRMTPKLCFHNSITLARIYNNLTYYEGYVFLPKFPLPIHHAWVVDNLNQVIDPTLEDPSVCQYIGLPITLDEYKANILNDSNSVLDTNRGVNVRFMTERCPELLIMMSDEDQNAINAWLSNT